jgi:hypothetical protein
MGNIQVVNSSPTLYSKVAESTPAQFAKDNPGMAAAGAIGTGVIVKQVVDHSQLAATVFKKGVVPALGVSAAVLGASMVKDALQNDLPKAGFFAKDAPQAEKEAQAVHNRNVAIKTVGGAAMAVTGIEVAGHSTLGVSPILKTAEMITKYIPGESFAFAGLAAAGAAGATWGAKNMGKEGVTLGNAAALGGGAFAATGLTGVAVWNAFEFSPHVETIMKVGDKVNGVVGGAALGLGAYALGKSTLEALDEGKTGKAALMGAGAASAVVASIHVLGNATGAPALANLGPKLFTKNPLLAGSIAAVGLTAGAYYLYSQKKEAAETGK